MTWTKSIRAIVCGIIWGIGIGGRGGGGGAKKQSRDDALREKLNKMVVSRL